ncbi:CGNR zinc finger domain-containing protein [Streptomyces clavifer]|uniref:CGNR zinc finger domain-containing protein n=1 Tax=Streptomyces clavifer TaxID=68188 RepID=UPI0037A41B99
MELARLAPPSATARADRRDALHERDQGPAVMQVGPGDSNGDESLHAVNEALTAVPTAPLLAWDGAQGMRRVQAHPTDQAVNHALATLAADLLTGPDADILAVCGSTPCDRFLLRTHGRRHWCSTRCGDRVRAARAYARRSGASG